LDKYYGILQNCFFSQFSAFVSAIKQLNNLDYKKLNETDRGTLIDLRRRYGHLLAEITAVCNKSLGKVNKMMHVHSKEELCNQLTEFTWEEFNSLVTTTQRLQVDVSAFKVTCEKYKEPESFWLNLFLTLAATTTAIGAGLACLVAAPAIVTTVFALGCASAGLSAITMATVTLKDWKKRQESEEIGYLQQTLTKVELQLSGITRQQNKIIDMQGDYDEKELQSMKEVVGKLKKEIVALRNLASKEITF